MERCVTMYGVGGGVEEMNDMMLLCLLLKHSTDWEIQTLGTWLSNCGLGLGCNPCCCKPSRPGTSELVLINGSHSMYCLGLGWVGFLLLHVGHNHPRVNPKNVRGQGQVDWPRMLPGAHPDYLWLEGSWIWGLVTCAVVKAAFPIPTVGSRPDVYKSCVVTLGLVVGVVKVKPRENVVLFLMYDFDVSHCVSCRWAGHTQAS